MKSILKILAIALSFSICPNSWGQDTICLNKGRLARIADTLSFHKMEHQRYKDLYSLQNGTIQILETNDSLYRASFRQSNKQLGNCRDAFLLEQQNAQRWKDQANENRTFLQEQVLENEKLFKKKNTFKGLFWGTLVSGVLTFTTLILL